MADITAGKRPDELPGRADITVGLRVPHELPGGAAGLRDFAARAEATGIDRLFVGDHVTFRGGHGLWVSPRRYAAAVELIAKHAADQGRQKKEEGPGGTEGGSPPCAEGVSGGWQHGMHVWCGIGASAAAARPRLAAVMEAFYRVPFGKFESYCPCGTPAEIAAGLRPYVDEGCRSFNLIPVANSEQAAIEGADAVRTALREEHR